MLSLRTSDVVHVHTTQYSLLKLAARLLKPALTLIEKPLLSHKVTHAGELRKRADAAGRVTVLTTISYFLVYEKLGDRFTYRGRSIADIVRNKSSTQLRVDCSVWMLRSPKNISFEAAPLTHSSTVHLRSA